ncbi:MAG: PAS domain-containing protein [Planctomycetes bacterium]|nr:PAS domain-containing protein [Planctomycetota bacterium]
MTDAEAGTGALLDQFLRLSADARRLRACATEDVVLDCALLILRDTLGYPSYCLLREASGDLRTLRASPDAPPVPSRTLLGWAVQQHAAVGAPLGVGRCWILAPLDAGGESFGVLAVVADGPESGLPRYRLQMIEHLASEAAWTLAQLRGRERMASLSDLFHHVLESVPHGLLALSRDDRIVACNRNFEFLFGLRRVDLLDAPYREALPKPLSELLDGLIASTLSGRQIVDQEFPLRTGDGPEVVVGFSTALLQGERGPEGILLLCRDLELSREVQKLRDLDVMKTEFVHTVSHELKTPLTAILGGTELLLADAAGLSSEQREVLGFIEEGGRRLQALITDLLDLSRLESGSAVMERVEVYLPDLVKEMLPVVAPINPRCAPSLDVAGPFPHLLLDREKMRQIVQNLLSNALKYSPEGGAVRIRLSARGAWASFEVSDQGIGILPEHLDRIWEKFYRVDSSTTASIEGTGLGLPIVKHLVELHGGRVEVESAPGAGSTFRVLLPIGHGAEPAPL